jgi:electron transfer flavoprotein beta subunit
VRIVVCAKQVPATDSKLLIAGTAAEIDRSSLSYVVNPYDEFALEAALQTKERIGAEVTVLSLRSHASQRAEDALRTCLAMGADKAVLLADPAFEGGDSLATATALAAALRRLSFDLILCGKQAVDDDGGAVGIQVAELLGIPHVAVVNKLDLDVEGRMVVAHRQIEGGLEIMEVPLPAVITCQKGLNEPRYPSLPGIMKAKQKPLEIWTREMVGTAPEEVGANGSGTRLLRLEPPPARPAGRVMTGDASTSIKELVRLLREEAKVI